MEGKQVVDVVKGFFLGGGVLMEGRSGKGRR